MKYLVLVVCALVQCSLSTPIEDDSTRSKSGVSELTATEFSQATALENVVDSSAAGKTEYVVLISYSAGQVIIIDGSTFEQIKTYYEPKLSLKSVAIVNDTMYNIDTIKGTINSTNISNIITSPQGGVNWTQVGSFPNGSNVETVAAVNGSVFYFLQRNGVLYKYDTVFKTVTKCADLEVEEENHSLIIVKGVVYIYTHNISYSFDGTVLTKLPTPESRTHPALFESEGNVCVVGGDLAYAGNEQHPVYCYDPIENMWAVNSYSNEARDYLAIARTRSGTIIYGGRGKNSDGSTFYLTSVEIFNHDSKVWGYILSPPALGNSYYTAISFDF